MNDVTFQEDNQVKRPHADEEKAALVEFVERRGYSEATARKIIYGIGAVAFIASLFFWAQVL